MSDAFDRVTAHGRNGGISVARGDDGRYYVKAWQFDDSHVGVDGKANRIKLVATTVQFSLSANDFEGVDGLANAIAFLIPGHRVGPMPVSSPTPPAKIHAGWFRRLVSHD